MENKKITLADKLKQMNEGDRLALERADIERREILGNEQVNLIDGFLARFDC